MLIALWSGASMVLGVYLKNTDCFLVTGLYSIFVKNVNHSLVRCISVYSVLVKNVDLSLIMDPFGRQYLSEEC